ncbi:calcium-binding protein [Prosthecomicrobium sp. N25]|uniref:calcium-binding protein n=1 Tax=Prosthecomicrobium sp. N25 TaxID=3129254 RepID=UPI003077F9C3
MATTPTSGDDTITGTAGFDSINAGAGSDTVYAGDGNDKVAGGDGADLLYGDNGNDKLWGDAGNDTLVGGAGNDTMLGGSGYDTFQYNFAVTESHTEEFHAWALAHGYTQLPNGTDPLIDSTGEVADGTAVGQFDHAYEDWLTYIVAKYGLGQDLDNSGSVNVSIDVDNPYRLPKIEGMTDDQIAALFSDFDTFKTGVSANAKTWNYADDFGSDSFAVTASEGSDQIFDQWIRSPEGGIGAGDKFRFVGMTSTQWDGLLANGLITGTAGDFNADGRADFKVTISGTSIMIAGTDNFHFDSLTQLKGYIVFDDAIV